MRKTIAIAVTALWLVAPSAGWAQRSPLTDPSEPQTTPAGRTPVGSTETAPAPTGQTDDSVPTESAAASASSEGARASSDSSDVRALHAKDESIYVVQQRAFTKRSKFELTPFVLTGINPKFVGYVGGALSAAYHVRENLALEVTSSIPYLFFPFYSTTVVDVYEKERLTPEAVDLKQMTYFGSVSLQLSALYGKLRFYDNLLDYDFYVTVGMGAATTRETCNASADGGDPGCTANVGGAEAIGRGMRKPIEDTDSLKVTGNLGGGMRFFFSDWAGLRLEVRDIVYSDKALDRTDNTTDIRNNFLLLVGLSFMI